MSGPTDDCMQHATQRNALRKSLKWSSQIKTRFSVCETCYCSYH